LNHSPSCHKPVYTTPQLWFSEHMFTGILAQLYCEMLPDGGWTVFQRRSGPAVSFVRKWTDYRYGFGALTQDHWLSLKKVFFLTKNKSKMWTMRVDLWDHEGGTVFAEYKNFVGKYSGNAGTEVLKNGYGFSTTDRDNDGCSPCIFGDIAESDCSSSEGGGGWWDFHATGQHIFRCSGLHWRT
uniref:Fibrinogen C-terminal domain-containing protein n=1 Tax=Amphiprion ocellaris TaxID=80972 RepID=A0A3Q1B7I1_AMPOC